MSLKRFDILTKKENGELAHGEFVLAEDHERYVRMLCGYLCAAIPELHNYEVPKMLEHIEAFNARLAETGLVLHIEGSR